MSFRTYSGAAAIAFSASLCAPSFAWAAPPAAPATSAPPPTVASPASSTPPAPTDKLAEARRRYDRALELSDEGSYDDALLELQRAYALAPTYRLLYNLGVVSVAVHDSVKAIDYFERYLAEGGSEIDAQRVAEVQAQLGRLRNRIAKLSISTNIPNAEISVDDVAVGRTPLPQPLTVNAGRHRISATSAGFFPANQSIELAGNDSKSVTLVLVRPNVVAEKPSRPLPWIAYGVTAVLAAGTVVTGALALGAESDYDRTVGTFGVDDGTVNSAYKKMRTWSVTSDVFLGTTVIAAAVSVYLTIRSQRAPKEVKTGLISVTPAGLAF